MYKTLHHQNIIAGIAATYKACRLKTLTPSRLHYHQQVRRLPYRSKGFTPAATRRLDDAYRQSVSAMFAKLPFHQKHWTYDHESGDTTRAEWFK